jgi:hypothetical protein
MAYSWFVKSARIKKFVDLSSDNILVHCSDRMFLFIYTLYYMFYT